MGDYIISKKKAAIIGAGFVGASIAYALTIRGVAREIVFIDIDKEKVDGEAMDIQHGIPELGGAVVRAGSYEDCADCDLIVITAGRNRKPGESRLDLISGNTQILRNVVDSLKKYYTGGAILLVSNPVDILVYECTKFMDLPDGRVFGTGCALDSSRMVRMLSDYTKRDTEAVKINIVGEHGDAQISIWSRASIDGILLPEYCKRRGISWGQKEKEVLSEKVRGMGAAIIKEKGRTHFGIATTVCYLAEAVLGQRPSIASVSTVLQGEYGVSGVALSVPSVIGVNGVERRLEETWSDEELTLFRQAADKMKGVLDTL